MMHVAGAAQSETSVSVAILPRASSCASSCSYVCIWACESGQQDRGNVSVQHTIHRCIDLLTRVCHHRCKACVKIAEAPDCHLTMLRYRLHHTSCGVCHGPVGMIDHNVSGQC